MFTFSIEQQITIRFASMFDISLITFILNNTVTLLATFILEDHGLIMTYILLTMLTIKKTIVSRTHYYVQTFVMIAGIIFTEKSILIQSGNLLSTNEVTEEGTHDQLQKSLAQLNMICCTKYFGSWLERIR